MITMQRKQEVFEANKYSITAMYCLGNWVMLRQQLIKLIMNYRDCCESLAVADIVSMEETGLIKSDFFFNTNNHVLYLTKSAVALLTNKSSKEVRTLTLTDRRVILSMYRTKYYLISPYLVSSPDVVLRDMFSKTKTVFINKNKENNIYKMFYKKYKDKDKFLTDDFLTDYKISVINNIINSNKLLKVKKPISKENLKIKTDREETIKALINSKNHKDDDDDDKVIVKKDVMFSYFNFSNMLSKNFFIEGFKPEKYVLTVDLGYWDILKTDNLYQVYKDIAYIYLMLRRYFRACNKNFDGTLVDAPFDVKINVNIYVDGEKRKQEFMDDSDSVVYDFFTKERQRYRKAKTAMFITSGKDERIVENVKLNFINLNIDK